MRDSIAAPGEDGGAQPASPTTTDTPPPNAGPDQAPAPAAAPEEALAQAVSQVEQAQEALRALEAQREQVRATFEKASAEADALISQVTESYEQEQQRLEAELLAVRERVAGLERFRESRLGNPPAAGSEVLPEVPTPAPPSVPPSAAPPSGANGHSPAPGPGAPVALEPARADVPHPTPQAVLTPVPAAGDPAPDDVPAGNGTDPASTDRHDPPPAAVTVEPGRTEAAGSQDEEGDGAYEDHWYQVLRRNRLGSRS